MRLPIPRFVPRLFARLRASRLPQRVVEAAGTAARAAVPRAERLLAEAGRIAAAVAREWLEILAPSYCRACGGGVVSPSDAFCASCREGIEWIERACIRCGTPLPNPPRTDAAQAEAAEPNPTAVPGARRGGAAPGGEPGSQPPPCSSCAAHPSSFDRAAAGGRYAGALRTAVLRFKFQRDLGVRGLLEEALLRAAASEALAESVSAADALVPVPLHPLKALWRGWNPVEELARGVAGRLRGGRGVPLLLALRKVRWTRAQVNLAGKARRRNLRRAFRVRRGIRIPPTVVLLDDVLTTGTTASECSLALKRAGAKRVVVLAIARS